MSANSYKVKCGFSVIPHSENRVELRSGIWNTTSIIVEDFEKKGKLYQVIKHLNGENLSKDIAKLCQIPISQVEEVIDHLLNLGVLEKLADNNIDNFLATYMPIFSSYQKKASLKPVLLLGDEALKESLAIELKKVLPESLVKTPDSEDVLYQDLQIIDPQDWLFDGISFLEKVDPYKAWKDYFVVLAFEQINPVVAKNFNRIAFEHEISWMQVALDGPFIFIGPTFEGGESPCFACLEKRITMNLRESANYQHYKKAIIERKIEGEKSKINPLLLSLITAHASIEIINLISAKTSFTTRKILSIYLPTMEFAFNELLALSSCEVCGASLFRTGEQLYFDMQKQLGLQKI